MGSFIQFRVPSTVRTPALPKVQQEKTVHAPGKRIFHSPSPVLLTNFEEQLRAFGIFPVSGELNTARNLARFDLEVGYGFEEGLSAELMALASWYAWSVEVYDNPDGSRAVVFSNPVLLFHDMDTPVMVKNRDTGEPMWQGYRFKSLSQPHPGEYELQ